MERAVSEMPELNPEWLCFAEHQEKLAKILRGRKVKYLEHKSCQILTCSTTVWIIGLSVLPQ